MLQGKARLELSRKGKVVHRVEKKNTITGWHKNAVCRGDFAGGLDRLDISKVMPLTKWFDGCLLTDAPNPNNDDVPGFFGMIAGNANVVAMAGNDAYTGSNTRRGSADLTAGNTGPITNGYRWTWRWSESVGNGHIESVGLTRGNLGKLHYVESGNLDYEVNPSLEITTINESLTGGALSQSHEFRELSVIDYEKELGYKVWYEGDSSSGDIMVEEYALSTKRPHLTGEPFGVRHKIGSTHIINMASGIRDYDIQWNSCVTYTGDKLHLITWGESTGRVSDYIIDPTDYSAIAQVYERNYSDIEFKANANYAVYQNLTKDRMWIEYEEVNGVSTPFLYAIASVLGVDKIVKCNLTNDSQVSEVATSPISLQSPWIGLPNGDRYIVLPRGYTSDGKWVCDAVYHHNGRWYRTQAYDYSSQGYAIQGIQGGGVYGTNLYKFDTNRTTEGWSSVDAMFGWVSTCANLDTAVDKNASLTMTLVYEITEV